MPLYGAMQCRVTTEDPERISLRITVKFRRIVHPRDLAFAWTGEPPTRGGACGLLRFSAGEGHRVGQGLAGSVPAHGSGAARIPDSRRHHQHPVLSRMSLIIRRSGPAKSQLRFWMIRRSCSGFAARRSCYAPASYLGDVILNGNPEVKGKKFRRSLSRRWSGHPGNGSAGGTRQLLQKLGPKNLQPGRAKKSAC